MIPVSSAFLTVCAGVNLPSLPSFLTVTLPLLSTSIVASAKSGLAAFTASLIFSCSAGVTLFGSATSTGVGALTPSLLSSCLTVFSAGIVPRTLSSLSLTVTVPSSATSTFAPSGRSLFAFFTASSTAFLFSGVNAFALSTVIGVSGALIPVSGASSFSIVSSGPNLAVFVVSPSFTVTVTLPLSSTLIWSSVSVGLTSFTASLIFACSSVVTFCGSLTLTGLGLFNVNFVASSTTVSF